MICNAANIEDQTTEILGGKKTNTIMVSHFSETMPKFEAIPVQHCHFKVPSWYKYCRSSDQMSGEPVNDDWLKCS